MTPDVNRLIGFYKSPLGKISRALVREQIVRMADRSTGGGCWGWALPRPICASPWSRPSACSRFMPARQGADAWPREGPSHTVICDPLEMPLTDAAVDLIIAVHAFEHIADAEELMRELWRVAAPNARLIVVVPRRRGLWAALDNTPFGDGNPFSRRQVERLLRAHSFVPESWREALYLPPSNHRLVLRLARFFERFGRLLGPLGAGVIVRRGAQGAVSGGAAAETQGALCAGPGPGAADGDGGAGAALKPARFPLRAAFSMVRPALRTPARSWPDRPEPQPGILEDCALCAGPLGRAGGASCSIKLSANESPLGASPKAIEAYRAMADTVSRSIPRARRGCCARRWARCTGSIRRGIVCGNGSDDLLHLLAQVYLGEGDAAVMSRYGFNVYPIVTRGASAEIVMARRRPTIAPMSTRCWGQ